MARGLLVFTLTIVSFKLIAQLGKDFLLQPDRVFDGEIFHDGWMVSVTGNRIKDVGPAKNFKEFQGSIIELKGMTLMPGIIDAHSHVLLHPYNETSWNDQVLKESETERVVRATKHLEKTLMAGVTMLRDLGTEGAGYADVGLKASIEKGIIHGPRMQVATKAIVSTGSYGPKGFAPQITVPLGAEVADGHDDLIKVVRDQIGKGADFIKVYADYRWGPEGKAKPTFSLEELQLIVETAKSSGRVVVAHASSQEGMRRAILAGVTSIEHGDEGTEEIFNLMREKGVAWCPTLAAGDAILQYQGWNKGVDPDPPRIKNKKEVFRIALKSGVDVLMGGDVGVFPHGDNVREMVLMQAYGMDPIQVLRSATSLNAAYLGVHNQMGKIKPNMLADIIAVEGDPVSDMSALRKVTLVIKGGVIYKQP